MTTIEQLTGITPAPKQHLGTLINLNNDSAEMYSNTYSNSTDMNKKENTFQQSTSSPTQDCVNVCEASPPSFASQGASHPGVKEDQREVRETTRYYGREAKPSDYFIDIQVSLGEVKEGTRTSRCPIYFSLKTDTDKKYNIFLRSKLTTSTDETMRSIMKTNNLPLRDILNDVISLGGENLMVGRIQYKPTNGFITDQHRKNHKNGLAAVFTHDGIHTCYLYFNGEEYMFELTDDMTMGQSKVYTKVGNWIRDNDEEIA